MNKYKFLYLFWLLPAYFMFLSLHQTAVYYGLKNTFHNGSSYMAEVVDFEIEQIAAQTNGSAVLRFQINERNTIQELLSLPTNVISRIGEAGVIPIRYRKDAFIEIVIIPTYEMQKKFALSNVAMAGIAFIITFFVGLIAHRYANKKLKEGDEDWVIERID